MTKENIQHIPYNTEMPTLKLPEYGRCVVQMIEQLKTFADREDRTKQAYKVVKVMERLTPEWKGMEGHEQVLWDHLAYLANYELDIDWPLPIRRMEEEPVSKLEYPGNNIKYLHYGSLIENMLVEIAKLDNAVDREKGLMKVLQRMKKNLVEWKGEQGNLNEKIARDVEMYTQGVIRVDEVLPLLEKRLKVKRR